MKHICGQISIKFADFVGFDNVAFTFGIWLEKPLEIRIGKYCFFMYIYKILLLFLGKNRICFPSYIYV